MSIPVVTMLSEREVPESVPVSEVSEPALKREIPEPNPESIALSKMASQVTLIYIVLLTIIDCFKAALP